MLTVAKSAMDRELRNFREGLCDRCIARPELHLAESRCVDKEHTRGQPDEVPVRCSVPSLTVFFAHASGLAHLSSAEHIDQGRFAHARRAEQHNGFAHNQQRAQFADPLARHVH